MVTIYTGDDYVKSTMKWQVGDILVSNTHAVVVVAGTAPSGSVSAESTAVNLTTSMSWHES